MKSIPSRVCRYLCLTRQPSQRLEQDFTQPVRLRARLRLYKAGFGHFFTDFTVPYPSVRDFLKKSARYEMPNDYLYLRNHFTYVALSKCILQMNS